MISDHGPMALAKPSMAVKLSVPEAVSLIDVKVSPDWRRECIIQCSDSGNLAQVVHVAYDVVSGPVVTDRLLALCREVSVGGRQIHDANIVATMLAYGERRLLTFNTADFRRYGDRIELFSS